MSGKLKHKAMVSPPPTQFQVEGPQEGFGNATSSSTVSEEVFPFSVIATSSNMVLEGFSFRAPAPKRVRPGGDTPPRKFKFAAKK